MNVLKFQGTDKQLYELVAPLVMSPAILRQNNNYPFKTSRSYMWYIAIKDDTVVGFFPVKRNIHGLYIDNYYVCGDDLSILDILLQKVIMDLDVETTVWAIVHKRHAMEFAKHRFIVCTEWKKYTKMQYLPVINDTSANSL